MGLIRSTTFFLVGLGGGRTGSSPSVFGSEPKLLWVAVRRVCHGDKAETIVRMQIKKSGRVLLST